MLLNSLPVKRIRKAPISTILILLLIAVCLSSSEKNLIKKVKLKYSIDLVKLTGELFTISDSIYIYYDKDKIVYALRFTYSEEDEVRILKMESRYHYFEIRKGDTIGRYFNSLNLNDYRVENVDSITQLSGYTKVKYYDKSNDSLISNEKIGQEIVEKYIPKIKRDITYPDSTFYYYTDKFRDVKFFTFSPFLDSMRSKKVFKVLMLYNSGYFEGYNFKVPARKFLFEMQECQVEPSDSALFFFKEKEVDIKK